MYYMYIIYNKLSHCDSSDQYLTDQFIYLCLQHQWIIIIDCSSLDWQFKHFAQPLPIMIIIAYFLDSFVLRTIFVQLLYHTCIWYYELYAEEHNTRTLATLFELSTSQSKIQPPAIKLPWFYLTIRLWARDLYDVVVDEATCRINYLIIKIESK